MKLLEIKDLPRNIRFVVLTVMRQYERDKLHTVEGADGMCVRTTRSLIEIYKEVQEQRGLPLMFGHGGSDMHTFAELEGFGIDLTARQFNKYESFPKIWKLVE